MDRDETGRRLFVPLTLPNQTRGWSINRIRPITGSLDHTGSRWHTFSIKPEAVEAKSLFVVGTSLVKVIVPIKHGARWTGANSGNSTWTVHGNSDIWQSLSLRDWRWKSVVTLR